MKNDLGPSFNRDILTTMTLIDSLIKPILLYASDFWGCLKLPKNNPIENLHMMMCKQVLGVQKQTTNIGVLLELGRIPLGIWALKFAVKNWERIRLGHANKILIDAYNNSEVSWDATMKSVLESNGMMNFYVNEPVREFPFVYKRLFQQLIDNFHQRSLENIKDDSSKLRTYGLVKTEAGMEDYLQRVKNVKIRSQVTKLRLSNHRLAIETGRHSVPKVPRGERFCPFCPGHVEDEFHFLFECAALRHLRCRLLDPVTGTIPEFQYFPKEIKLKTLMSDIDFATCKYIADGMDLKNFLASKPRSYS